MSYSDLNSLLAKYDALAAWVTRLAVVLGIAGIYWLKGEFVTQAQHAADMRETNQRLGVIEKVLVRMEEKLAHDHRQDSVLGDHETRLRFLEQKR